MTAPQAEAPVGGPFRVGTAGSHAASAVPVAAPSQTAAEVRDALVGRRFDSVAVIAVCDAGRLVGLLTIERLLAADAETPLREIMDSEPPVVAPDTDQEVAARKAVDRREPGLAVVDASGRFHGLIPPHRLLGVLLEEHHEDLARLGGYLGSASAARTAMTESVRRRLWHRLPWLLVGLVGALLSAIIVGSFERELSAHVLIAFFLPGVVYLADAIGTQTEALVIRGMSAGIPIRRVAVRESVTGVFLGLLLAALSFPVIALFWGDATVALAVSLALLAASSIATVVAMALPWLIQRLGLDPAFGSGPLSTVVQDLLSVTLYFVTATLLLP